MRFNRKLLAAILTLCLMLGIASPAAAATLEVTLGEASYYDIATTAYTRMLLFENGVVAAANQDKQYGLIDAAGKVVVPFQYAGMWSLGGGLYRVSDTPEDYSGKQGIIDSTGKVVLAMQENRQIEVCGNVLQVYDWAAGQRGTYTYYTLDMKPSTEAAWDAAYDARYASSRQDPPQLSGYQWWYEAGDFYQVFKDDQVGLLDKNFRTVFALGRYDALEYAGGSVFIATSGDDSSVVDTNGRVIVAAGTYDDIGTRGWGNGATIIVTKGDQSGVIDTAGKLIVPLGEYNDIGGQNQLGYISAVTYEGESYNGTLSNIVSRIYKDGALVKTISGKYVATEAYFRQLVFTTTGELNGVMDINENILLPEKYEQIYDDSNGNMVLCVPNENDWSYTYGLATMDGKRIFEDRYTQMNALGDNNYKLNDGSHYGIMNTSGKTLLPFRYEDMRVYNNSFIELYDGVYYSCADINNNVVVPNSSTPIVLFKGQPAQGNLSYEIERLYLGDYYDGGAQDLQPFCITTPEGLATVYADYATGKATDRINGVWASNINKDNQFAYQASSGLFGLGTVGTAPAAGPVNPFNDVVSTSPFYDSILWAVDQGITNGTSSTTFSPSNTCTVRQILTFLYRAAGKPGAVAGQNDLDAAVSWAAAEGILAEGVDSTAACTRSMAVEFMWRYAGRPEAALDASFTDVDTEASYIMAVSWALAEGITNGTGGDTFSPNNTCTRGQIVTFLYRAFAEK